MRIASIPVILAGIYSIAVFKNLKGEMKILCYFIFLSLTIEVASKIFWLMQENNLVLLHIYVFLGFIIQSWFYAKVLKGFIDEKIIWGIAALFSVFTLINSFFIQDISSFNTYALIAQSTLILILSISSYLLFLNDIFKSEKNIAFIKSLNWINTGLFIYYSSSLILFSLSNIVADNYSILSNQYVWAVHTLFLIAMYGSFMVGLRYSSLIKSK